MKTQHTEGGREHRWTHFFHHLRIFIYVMALLVAIDLISGTDDIWVHWVAGIWGAILGIHLIETMFFDGGLFGSGSQLRDDRDSSQSEPNDNLRREHL